jgi:glutamyl-tRNA(Gln) amidotransferase subunit D
LEVQFHLADYTADDFFAMMPELSNIANIKAQHHSSMMSEDFTPEVWKQIADAIQPLLLDSSISGIVISQGTDTLHYSTSALSFALQNLNKPVIFTAAQKSIDRGSSDAFMNIICAVNAAAKWDGACVATCMHETTNDDACLLIRGTRVRKMHTSRRDAFRPINEPALARVHPDGRITPINQNYPKRTSGLGNETPIVKSSFASDVSLLTVHPGVSPKLVDFFVANKYRGIVVAATALGHVPENLVEPLSKATKAGIVVVIATQTIYGRVHPFVYSRLRDMSITGGMLFAQDMLVETAFAKLSWVLAHTSNSQQARALMETKLCGEWSDEIDNDSFLN